MMAFEGLSLCGVHRKGITQSFARYGFNCVENIRRSWKTLENFASTSKQSLLPFGNCKSSDFQRYYLLRKKSTQKTFGVFLHLSMPLG